MVGRQAVVSVVYACLSQSTAETGEKVRTADGNEPKQCPEFSQAGAMPLSLCNHTEVLLMHPKGPYWSGIFWPYAEPCPHYTAILWSECCRLHPCPDGEKEAQAGTTKPDIWAPEPTIPRTQFCQQSTQHPCKEQGVRRQESEGHRKGPQSEERPEDEDMKLRISFRAC